MAPHNYLAPDNGQGEDEMPDAFASLHNQNMAQLGQIGIVAQQGFATVARASDYSYLQGKDMVSLTEALGAREVGSEVSPGGPRKLS